MKTVREADHSLPTLVGLGRAVECSPWARRARVGLPMVLATWLGACGSDASAPPGDGAGAQSDDGGRGDAAPDGDPNDGAAPADGALCVEAREQLLHPIDLVSTGDVTVLAESAGVRTLYVDATTGGTQAANTNPRVYLNLETTTRIAVTDKSAAFSADWDLAIKRPILFTNSGDGGAGRGGAILLDGRAFDSVTAADAAGKTFAPESFVEADCTPKTDQTGAMRTSFDGWYDYDETTNQLSPHPGTWLVRGGTGKTYKLRILSYYGAPDGGAGQSGGRYLVQIAALGAPGR